MNYKKVQRIPDNRGDQRGIFTSLFVLVGGLITLHIGIKQITSAGLGTNPKVEKFPSCQVKEGSIYDGDTLKVLCSGQEIKVRFACVDAPEKTQEGGIESRDYLRSLLRRANNRVEVEATDTDRYGRTVAQLWFEQNGGWRLVQEAQASAGMVWE